MLLMLQLLRETRMMLRFFYFDADMAAAICDVVATRIGTAIGAAIAAATASNGVPNTVADIASTGAG